MSSSPLPLSWWRELFSSGPVSELTLFEYLSELIVDRVRPLPLARPAEDMTRLHLGILRARHAAAREEGPSPSERSVEVARLSAERFLTAIERVEGRTDSVASAARALQLLCAGSPARACTVAQEVVPVSAVLQAALRGLGRGIDPIVLMGLTARRLSLSRALPLAELFAARPWWSELMRDFATEQFVSGRSLDEVSACVDQLGWARLDGVQQRQAVMLLRAAGALGASDGRAAAEAARGVRRRSAPNLL